jgi:hypothetical protein
VKVGDLIKVYNFTYKARTEFRERWKGSAVDAHFVGLIVGSNPPGNLNRAYRLVLRPDGETEFYNLDRMEIINASR